MSNNEYRLIPVDKHTDVLGNTYFTRPQAQPPQQTRRRRQRTQGISTSTIVLTLLFLAACVIGGFALDGWIRSRTNTDTVNAVESDVTLLRDNVTTVVSEIIQDNTTLLEQIFTNTTILEQIFIDNGVLETIVTNNTVFQNQLEQLLFNNTLLETYLIDNSVVEQIFTNNTTILQESVQAIINETLIEGDGFTIVQGENGTITLEMDQTVVFRKKIYADAAGGDDANDGLSPGNAVRTLVHAIDQLALFPRAEECELCLMGVFDLGIDPTIDFYPTSNMCGNITITGMPVWGATGTTNSTNAISVANPLGRAFGQFLIDDAQPNLIPGALERSFIYNNNTDSVLIVNGNTDRTIEYLGVTSQWNDGDVYQLFTLDATIRWDGNLRLQMDSNFASFEYVIMDPQSDGSRFFAPQNYFKQINFLASHLYTADGGASYFGTMEINSCLITGNRTGGVVTTFHRSAAERWIRLTGSWLQNARIAYNSEAVITRVRFSDVQGPVITNLRSSMLSAFNLHITGFTSTGLTLVQGSLMSFTQLELDTDGETAGTGIFAEGSVQLWMIGVDIKGSFNGSPISLRGSSNAEIIQYLGIDITGGSAVRAIEILNGATLLISANQLDLNGMAQDAIQVRSGSRLVLAWSPGAFGAIGAAANGNWTCGPNAGFSVVTVDESDMNMLTTSTAGFAAENINWATSAGTPLIEVTRGSRFRGASWPATPLNYGVGSLLQCGVSDATQTWVTKNDLTENVFCNT